MANDFTTRIWFSSGTTYTWPEQQAGVQPDVGVCFPGGGTRALSAAMGQLRGLINLGLLGSVDYISCVSGGSWASTAFAYYNAGATSDAQFLGPITDPANITMSGLDEMDANSLGWGATQDLGDALEAAHKAGVPKDQLWAAAIGQVFFARFGLYDPSTPAYFSLDTTTVKAIQAANSSLANATFHTVRQSSAYAMPYLLINATIDGPTSGAPYNPDPLVMVTYSPLYSGIPFQQTIDYVSKGAAAIGATVSSTVGGGFIESFAWGSGSPTATPSNGTVQVPPPAAPFGLVDASGTSSSAFAATFEKIKQLDGLLPEQLYWPPMSSGTQQAAALFDFGDGGNLENYGLIPLLLRGVKKIILFVNTEVPLSTSYDPSSGTATSADVDPNLPPLFGIPVTKGGTPAAVNNQVFPSSDYATLIKALQGMKTAGNAMVQPMTHQLQANTAWGLPGGGSVDVLYVYLDQVESWKKQISSLDVKLQLDLGDVGDFAHFPNYKTIDENKLPPWSLTQLTARQVNLLADLTCWVVRTNQKAFESFLSS
ncbi:MAG: hypothetical protein JXB05_20395 [Myxococcaceae bacterium]|nr:hypothetical protein [Myxococcaceae bacterium]